MNFTYDIDNFDFNEHITALGEFSKKVEYGKTTILTGPNGYGKSLLRKLVTIIKPDGTDIKVASVSMEKRTSRTEGFSALSSMAMDDPTDATSNATCHLIDSLFKNTENRFYIIDEPEVGMGKEMLMGLIEKIKSDIEVMKSKNDFHGILFISHSEYFIENMPHDVFINLEGKTYDEWKNRVVIPITPDKLSAWCLAMWRAIQKRISEK